MIIRITTTCEVTAGSEKRATHVATAEVAVNPGTAQDEIARFVAAIFAAMPKQACRV